MARHDDHSWHHQVAHERYNPYQGITPMMTKMKRSKKRNRVPALAVMLISTVAACLIFAPAFGAV